MKHSTLILLLVLGATVALPGAVTLFVPRRWLVLWAALLAAAGVYLWNTPFDGPAALFGFIAVLGIICVNGLLLAARIVKVAFDIDRESNAPDDA